MRERMRKVAAVALVVSLIAGGTAYVKEAYAQLSFINIDLSGTLNPNDFPSGMDCGTIEDQFVYVTIFEQGLLAKIDKNVDPITGEHAIQLIDQPDEQVATDQKFYSVTRDPNDGNLFMNEMNNGELWRFEPQSSIWIRIPIVEQIIHPTVSYPDGYNVKPTLITVDESAAPGIDPEHSPHTYQFGTESFGQVKFANGNVWVALAYTFDFDEFAEAVGVTDVSFAGLVKVNPTTLAVERIPIADAIVPAGIAVDATDPNILWVTDNVADKIYRFDTTTENVTLTISDPLIDDPKGVDTDANNIFVALNKLGDADFDDVPDGNSTIAQIDKSTLGVTIIDTGAPLLVTGMGTFGVFFNNGLLAWTDQSGHVGIIDLTTGEKSFETTTGLIRENFFGCVPLDGEFWFANRGSAKVGILPNSKFSGGRPVRATSAGGGGGGLFRGRDFAFGDPDGSNYDGSPPAIEEVLIQEGSIKILSKITDTVLFCQLLVVRKCVLPQVRSCDIE